MKRPAPLLVAAAAISSIMVPEVVDIPAAIFWNASRSVPIGLYRLTPLDALQMEEIVVVDPPTQLEDFIIERGYLPTGTPLLKRLAGLPGQTVCRRDRTISIDGVTFGYAQEHDREGRPMPVWQGCQRIAKGEVFLMNRDVEDSLDGRYFGPIPSSSVIGSAVPLWTLEERDPPLMLGAAVLNVQ
jgi:conjugative transfer signal peptidase TraF